jgi:iron complex outermembrane receptor protein
VVLVGTFTLALPLSTGRAQQATPLPPVAIDPAVPAKSKPRPTQAAPAVAPAGTQAPVADSADSARPRNGTEAGGVVLGRTGSLTVPTTAEVRAEVQRTPGGVAVVDQKSYADTPARTAKDTLDFVPGVFVQPKWGEDSRLSIRGSGLSRNNHTRGVLLYMDGIPITTSDGSGDMQEISPTAYRYIEVYKGANGLRYGANALGGAINFVTPTGRDASPFEIRTDFGGFGLRRIAVSSGQSAGGFDYFITSDALHNDGFRQHSETDSVRTSGNVGVRFNPDLETRFFLNNNSIQQRIPGTVRRDVALSSPETPRTTNITHDNQRNIDSTRIANKTAFRISGNTLLEVGGFFYNRDLNHPIGPFFGSYIQYNYEDR